VAKPEPETKRLCANCSAKFYDLNKDPIVCPKCQTVMELAAVSARRPEPVRAAAAEEEVVAPETADAEFVSLEEADAETSGKKPAEGRSEAALDSANAAADRRSYSDSSGCSLLCRTPRLFGRRNEKVGGHAETRAQSLYHCHAQLFLAAQDLAHSARRSEQGHHVRPREAVLVHEVPDQFCSTRGAPRPLTLLIGSDQTCLRLEPNHIGRVL
jgi:uncharacterized protein (TIGR02300 family)